MPKSFGFADSFNIKRGATRPTGNAKIAAG